MQTVSFVVHIFQSHASVEGEGKVLQRLDKNAVPSIFPQFPKHLQIIEKKKITSKEKDYWKAIPAI